MFPFHYAIDFTIQVAFDGIRSPVLDVIQLPQFAGPFAIGQLAGSMCALRCPLFDIEGYLPVALLEATIFAKRVAHLLKSLNESRNVRAVFYAVRPIAKPVTILEFLPSRPHPPVIVVICPSYAVIVRVLRTGHLKVHVILQLRKQVFYLSLFTHNLQASVIVVFGLLEIFALKIKFNAQTRGEGSLSMVLTINGTASYPIATIA